MQQLGQQFSKSPKEEDLRFVRGKHLLKQVGFPVSHA
jgi:hypothetical protein